MFLQQKKIDLYKDILYKFTTIKDYEDIKGVSSNNSRELPKNAIIQETDGDSFNVYWSNGYNYVTYLYLKLKDVNKCDGIENISIHDEKKCDSPEIPSTIECNGCISDNSCIAVGTRVSFDSIIYFCSVEKEFKLPNQLNTSCQNNYECKSNLCISSICTELTQQDSYTQNIKIENKGFFFKILSWLGII